MSFGIMKESSRYEASETISPSLYDLLLIAPRSMNTPSISVAAARATMPRVAAVMAMVAMAMAMTMMTMAVVAVAVLVTMMMAMMVIMVIIFCLVLHLVSNEVPQYRAAHGSQKTMFRLVSQIVASYSADKSSCKAAFILLFVRSTARFLELGARSIVLIMFACAYIIIISVTSLLPSNLLEFRSRTDIRPRGLGRMRLRRLRQIII